MQMPSIRCGLFTLTSDFTTAYGWLIWFLGQSGWICLWTYYWSGPEHSWYDIALEPYTALMHEVPTRKAPYRDTTHARFSEIVNRRWRSHWSVLIPQPLRAINSVVCVLCLNVSKRKRFIPGECFCIVRSDCFCAYVARIASRFMHFTVEVVIVLYVTVLL